MSCRCVQIGLVMGYNHSNLVYELRRNPRSSQNDQQAGESFPKVNRSSGCVVVALLLQRNRGRLGTLFSWSTGSCGMRKPKSRSANVARPGAAKGPDVSVTSTETEETITMNHGHPNYLISTIHLSLLQSDDSSSPKLFKARWLW